jgi:hypothetical protein
MGLMQWIKRYGAPGEDPRLLAWRESWKQAAASCDAAAVTALGSALDRFGLPEEDVEIEREMLGALHDLADLIGSVRRGGLPTVMTGHRLAGDRCHFTAPASMPDEPSQPGGRLLLTTGRAVFIGGTATRTVPWARVREVLQVGRDLVLVTRDSVAPHRFRCNGFSEALRSSFLARELMNTRGQSAADL